jgi:hypothetical protein
MGIAMEDKLIGLSPMVERLNAQYLWNDSGGMT